MDVGESHDKENTPRGCLKLNNKIYTVFEGHNTVGRHPEAVINIKNLNISKQHAVITVLDENSHYISDFKSSNGTVVDSTKLKPLKLYKLSNGASIKFGDVFCTYKTLENGRVVVDPSEASQAFSESFFVANTQQIDLPDLPSDCINFNEMPTQIFSHKELSINEMPTQVHDYDELKDESSNDSVDFATMQKASESQMFKAESQPKFEALLPVKLSTNNVESDAEEESPLSQIRPVRIGIKNVIESDSETDSEPTEDRTRSRYEISDDSDTDMEPDVEKVETDDVKNERSLNDSDFIPPSQDGGHKSGEQTSMGSFRLELSEIVDEKVEESDSVCGNLEEKKEEIEVKQQRNSLEDHMYCQSHNDKEDANTDSTVELEESQYTKILEETDLEERNTEKKIEEESLKLPQSSEEPVKMSLANDVEDESFEASSRGHLEELLESKKEDETSQEEIEDIFDLPTQAFGVDFASDKTPLLEPNEDKIEDLEQNRTQFEEKVNAKTPHEEKEDDDIYSPPTQALGFEDKDDNLEAKNYSSSSEERRKETTSKLKDDEIYLPPTQTLELLGDHEDNLNVKGANSTELDQRFSKIEDNEVDIYLPPTQALEYLHRDDKSASSEIVQPSSVFKDVDDLPPTQALENLLTEDKDEVSANSKTKQAPEDDNVFLAPQSVGKVIKKRSFGESSSSNKEEDDICLPPTQALEYLHRDDKSDAVTPSLEKPDLQDDDDIPHTQALERLLSDVEEELATTNKPEKDVFLSPVSRKKVLKKSPLTKTFPSKDDDDDFIQPTQALEALHEDHSNFNQVEDQLAEIFASQSLMGTQQLVDVLETRDEDIVDDSLIEDRASSSRSLGCWSFKKPLTDESVKKILGEDLEDGNNKENERGKEYETQEELHITDKALGKDKVKTYSKKKDNEEEKSGSNGSEKSLKEDKTNKASGEEAVKNEEPRRRGRRKQNLTIDAKDSDVVIIKDVEDSVVNRRRGRRKVIVVSDDEDQGVEVGQGEEKKKDKKKDEPPDGENKETNTRSGRRKQNVTADDEAKNGNEEEGNRKKGRRKQNVVVSDHTNVEVGKERKKDSSEDREGVKGSSNEEEGSRRRSRRQQTLVSDEQKAVTGQLKKSDEKVEDIKNKKGKKVNVENTKPVVDSSKKNLSEEMETPKNNSGEEEINTRRGRRKQNLGTSEQTPTIEWNKKEDNRNKEKDKQNKALLSKNSKDNSEEPEEGVRRTRRQHNTDEELTFDNKEKKGRKKDIDITNVTKDLEDNKIEPQSSTDERRSKRIGKRKTDEPDEVPKKITKKPPPAKPESSVATTPKKRTSNVDSEDDFDSKVPKIERVLARKTPARLRKPSRKAQEADDVISISSGVSEVISVSSASSDEPAKRARRLSANSRRLKKEEAGDKLSRNSTQNSSLSTSQLMTPERSRRYLKPKVVFTMMDNPELESLIRQLGGSVVDSVDACTVLVTETVKRSQKLLCAVAQGKPICSPKWLVACKKAHSFVDPWEYILVDPEAEKKWNFSLRESLNRSTEGKLLESYTFQLIVNNAADVLRGAIEACGGKCVRSLNKSITDNMIIVSSENNRSKYSKIVKQNPEIKVVEAEAIFDGTLRQEFRFSEYLLT